MKRSESPQHGSHENPGRFAYDGLHRAIHEKARLGIMTSLATHPDGLLFSDLKELCSLTDGNLNRHLQVLREAGLIEVRKGGRGKRSHTVCRITPAGLARFRQYLDELHHVIADVEAARNAAAPAKPSLKGLSTA